MPSLIANLSMLTSLIEDGERAALGSTAVDCAMARDYCVSRPCARMKKLSENKNTKKTMNKRIGSKRKNYSIKY